MSAKLIRLAVYGTLVKGERNEYWVPMPQEQSTLHDPRRALRHQLGLSGLCAG